LNQQLTDLKNPRKYNHRCRHNDNLANKNCILINLHSKWKSYCISSRHYRSSNWWW